jgi:hypothetical protein
MSIWKSLGIAGALLIAVAACAPHGYAQATPSLVTVIPLARSAAFEYRMDLVPNTPWTKSDTGLWVDKTHRATLEWRFKGDTTWKKATDFVRVTSRPDLPAAYYPISDPRLATMLFGLQEGKSYDYRVTVFAPGYPTEPVTGTFTTLTANVPTGSGSTIVIPANTPDIYAAIKTALGPFSRQMWTPPESRSQRSSASKLPGCMTLLPVKAPGGYSGGAVRRTPG